MARTGISFDQVAAAADQLTADGVNVTIQAVRGLLGTGSPNTIHRFLAEWRAAAPKPERKAKAMPVQIEAAIVDELERQTSAVRAELGKQLEQAKAEAGELAKVGETLEAENETLGETNQLLQADNVRLEAVSVERAGEIERLNAELKQSRETAEKLRLDLAQAMNKVELNLNQLDAQNAEIETLKKQVAASTKATNLAEKNQAVIEAKLQAEKTTVEGQKIRIERLEKDLEKQAAELKTRDAEIKTMARESGQTEKTLAVMVSRLETLEALLIEEKSKKGKQRKLELD